MNLSKIKQFVKQNGDKFIFVENGEPEAVMMSFQEYEKLMQHHEGMSTYADAPYMRRRQEYGGDDALGVTDWGDDRLRETEFVYPSDADSAGLPVRLEDIHLEDLPL